MLKWKIEASLLFVYKEDNMVKVAPDRRINHTLAIPGQTHAIQRWARLDKKELRMKHGP